MLHTNLVFQRFPTLHSASQIHRFASLSYSYVVVYIRHHIKMTDKIALFTRKLHMRSSTTVILHANPIKTLLKNYF